MKSEPILDGLDLGDIRIQVVDLDICNLTSMLNALHRIGAQAEVVRSAAAVGRDCEGVILPGVGAFSAGMDVLESTGIAGKVKELALLGQIPMLGVCLGMELLFDGSDEYGKHSGLGIIPGWVKQLQPAAGVLRVPNVGWCEVEWRDHAGILAGETDREAFYFVHSYWCDAARPRDVVGVVNAGFPMTAVVKAGTVMGTQFHPEKSLDAGLGLLRRFAAFTAGINALRGG